MKPLATDAGTSADSGTASSRSEASSSHSVAKSPREILSQIVALVEDGGQKGVWLSSAHRLMAEARIALAREELGSRAPQVERSARLVESARTDSVRDAFEAGWNERDAEYDTLLGEINHRTKNSLQLVASLLNQHCREVDDSEARQLFLEARSRVQTIARVYDRLCQTNKIEKIEFAEYLRELCTDLSRSFSSSGRQPALVLEAATAELSTRQAIPLALIVNELVTNAFKHAVDRADVLVKVQFACRPGSLKLRVIDDGVGLPEGFNPEASEGLGMRLVRALANQLNGRLWISGRRRGACFTVLVPRTRNSPSIVGSDS